MIGSVRGRTFIHSHSRRGVQLPTADQRIVTYGVPWSHYETQLALRGDASVPRMAYLEGTLELMSPSKEHERAKSSIGRLVEAYALERGVELSPYGAWTLKSAPKESGVEPDECYIVGSDQNKQLPDLAIEVVWTSGGIDKLEIYRRLGVGEVWFWRDGRDRDPRAPPRALRPRRSKLAVSRSRCRPARLVPGSTDGDPGHCTGLPRDASGPVAAVP